MSLIRIITSKVLQTAAKIELIATRVKAAGVLVRAAGSMARTYDNNTFGPEVRAICADGGARANKTGGFIGFLAVKLNLKALAFVKADGTFFSKIWTGIKKLFDADAQKKWTTGVEEEEIKEKSKFGELLEKIEAEKKLE